MELEKKEKYSEMKGIEYDSIEEIEGDIICHLKKEKDKWYFYFKEEPKVYDEDSIYLKIKQFYRIMGVWSMFGRKNDLDKWKCLQVAQKSNPNLERESIGCEIVSDLEIMFLPVPEVCAKCGDMQSEDRAFYKNVYKRHECEECNKKIQEREAFYEKFKIERVCKNKQTRKNLSRRFDIYHQIAEQYNELVIVHINNTNYTSANENGNTLKSNLKIEHDYAMKHQAIYFR